MIRIYTALHPFITFFNFYMSKLSRDFHLLLTLSSFRLEPELSSSLRCCASESGLNVKPRSAFSHSVRSSK